MVELAYVSSRILCTTSSCTPTLATSWCRHIQCLSRGLAIPDAKGFEVQVVRYREGQARLPTGWKADSTCREEGLWSVWDHRRCRWSTPCRIAVLNVVELLDLLHSEYLEVENSIFSHNSQQPNKLRRKMRWLSWTVSSSWRNESYMRDTMNKKTYIPGVISVKTK